MFTGHWPGGAAAGFSDSTARLVKWMDEEGMAPKWLKEIDWGGIWCKNHGNDPGGTGQFQEPFDDFLMTRTTIEFSEETAKRGIMGCPVSDSRDICEDHHLEARISGSRSNTPSLEKS